MTEVPNMGALASAATGGTVPESEPASTEAPPPAAKRRRRRGNGQPNEVTAAVAASGIPAVEPDVKPRRGRPRKAKPSTAPSARATVALRVTLRSDGYTSVYDRKADVSAADLETTVRKWLRSCRRR